MGRVLHGSARAPEAVRRAIQHSQESLRPLACRHGVNPKTIAKWRARGDVADRRTGPPLHDRDLSRCRRTATDSSSILASSPSADCPGG